MIVRIESKETRLFPTKSKTNFSVCLQLISPEEYLMRNHYPYQHRREKVIGQKLAKMAEFEAKRKMTPAGLLQSTNINSQLNSLVFKGNMNVGIGQFGGSVANERGSLNNKLGIGMHRVIQESMETLSLTIISNKNSVPIYLIRKTRNR